MQEKNKGNHFLNAPRQLALPFVYHPRFVSSDFIHAPSNGAARTWLGLSQTTYIKPHWPDRRLALWGAPGTGKTHLLQIWAKKENAFYIPSSALSNTSSFYWLDRLQITGVKSVVIDDADLILDFHILLNLLNMTKELGIALVLSGRFSPAQWDIPLPDLASRLRSITAIKIEQPEEELLRVLLLRLLADRQLIIPTSVIDLALSRLPRTASAVREAVKRLDEITLIEQKGITKNRIMAMLDDLFLS